MDRYIGVMSGTSLDGVDVVLCEIDSVTCKIICAQEFSFESELQKDILDAIANPVTLERVGVLHVRLGAMYAKHINTFLKQHNIDKKTVTAIGLHGQTLWHAPNNPHPFSMQLGDASVVATRVGIPVAYDFRSKDIANGGQGAPLAPAFHKFLFGTLGDVAVVNIGGMANITLLGKEFLGWDSGCGNVLLDYWIQKTQQKPYDTDGVFAQSGKVDNTLLHKMLDDPYFAKKPPKSTGREHFNAKWLEDMLVGFEHLNSADVQATLTELTAKTITKDIPQSEQIILCGGGAKNSYLIKRIAAHTTAKITSSKAYGVDADFLEAMMIAWLASMRIKEKDINLQGITGARKNSILGSLIL